MVCDQGSQIRCAQVFVQGVPAEGLIDSGAEITIMGSELFKKVANVNSLKKVVKSQTEYLRPTAEKCLT